MEKKTIAVLAVGSVIFLILLIGLSTGGIYDFGNAVSGIVKPKIKLEIGYKIKYCGNWLIEDKWCYEKGSLRIESKEIIGSGQVVFPKLKFYPVALFKTPAKISLYVEAKNSATGETHFVKVLENREYTQEGYFTETAVIPISSEGTWTIKVTIYDYTSNTREEITDKIDYYR